MQSLWVPRTRIVRTGLSDLIVHDWEQIREYTGQIQTNSLFFNMFKNDPQIVMFLAHNFSHTIKAEIIRVDFYEQIGKIIKKILFCLLEPSGQILSLLMAQHMRSVWEPCVVISRHNLMEAGGGNNMQYSSLKKQYFKQTKHLFLTVLIAIIRMLAENVPYSSFSFFFLFFLKH